MLFQTRPTPTFVAAASLLAFISPSTNTSFIPIVLLLSTLQVYARIIFTRPNAFHRVLFLWFSLSLASSLSLLLPSLNALSTPSMSLVVLFCFSAINTTTTLAAIYLDTKLYMRFHAPWSQITLFPAIWATTQAALSIVSPVGRLSTWSPVHGLDGYHWVAQWFGPVGNDWLVGAWAAVFSYLVGIWFIGESYQEISPQQELLIEQDDELPVANNRDHPQSNSHSVSLFAGCLLALTLPSFVINDLPLPPFTPTTTPLRVGCVLPTTQHSKHLSPTLDDFIILSKTMASKADILLWPESAVRFDTPGDRDAAFERVRNEIQGSYVGVAFEEYQYDLTDGNRRSGARRNGLALISNHSSTPHLTYFKRHLVPIAESFSLTTSTEPPTTYELALKHPKGYWVSPPYTRPIPVTASICLDLAFPNVFANLDTRPALILAPARTWHTSVGVAMWEQAQARADEIGSMVLWCDGGAGGVSGVAGGGLGANPQVGQGPWITTVGVQWPFDAGSQTIYARGGSLAALFTVFAIVGGGWFVEEALRRMLPGVSWVLHSARRVREIITEWREQRRISQLQNTPGEMRHLLG